MDRRDTCRYPVMARSAVLCFDVQGTAVECPAEIENISMQGCLVRSSKVPRVDPGQAVLLRIERLDENEPVQGVVVSSTKPFLRRHAVRIRFDQPLPFLAFKLLVYGPEGLSLEQRDRPMYETDQFWR
jgi:hypothetical protein